MFDVHHGAAYGTWTAAGGDAAIGGGAAAFGSTGDASESETSELYAVNITDTLDAFGLYDDGIDGDACCAFQDALRAAVAPYGGVVEFRVKRGNVTMHMNWRVMASFFAPVLAATATCIRAMAAQPAARGLA